MSATAARASNVLALPARPRPAGHGHERRERREGLDGQGGHDGDRTPVSAQDDPADDALDAPSPGGDDAAAPLDDALAVEDFDDDEVTSAATREPGSRTAAACTLPARPGGLLDGDDDARLAPWIDRIARQDAQALEALYDATAARVHGLVRRLTQRAALAEEVLEETYWQVWREAPRFDAARGRPISWLLSIARSRAIDALRRERRFQHEPLPDEGDDPAATWADAATPAPHALLEATRGHAHVHAALASLEPRARQLVALAFFRGLTHEEIARQQGLPLGTVKSLIRRALQQLRRVMEASRA